MNKATTTVDPQFNWRLRTWFPDLDEKTHAMLEHYFNLLIAQSKVSNIVPTKTLINADLVHFADSLVAAKIVRAKANKNEYLYDIGSGAGFPGMVYGIAYPDQKMALVEADERKSEFLKRVANELKLSNISVIPKKIETIEQDSITQAICREFAPLPLTLLTLRKLVKKGGVIYHMKTDQWSLEVSEIPSQLCSSWLPGLESKYSLPSTDAQLYVVRTDKI